MYSILYARILQLCNPISNQCSGDYRNQHFHKFPYRRHRHHNFCCFHFHVLSCHQFCCIRAIYLPVFICTIPTFRSAGNKKINFIFRGATNRRTFFIFKQGVFMIRYWCRAPPDCSPRPIRPFIDNTFSHTERGNSIETPV